MNYARDTDQLAAICCVDGLEEAIALFISKVVEERTSGSGLARDQSAPVQVVGDRSSLVCGDIELLAELRDKELLRSASPQQQQRLKMWNAVDLIDYELIDTEVFVVHRYRTLPFMVYRPTMKQLHSSLSRSQHEGYGHVGIDGGRIQKTAT